MRDINSAGSREGLGNQDDPLCLQVSPIVAAKEVMNGATVTKLQKGNLAARMELSEMVISAGKLLANE